MPTIEGATVAFESKVVGQFETGDHTVFLGEGVRRAVSCKRLSTYLSHRITHSLV
ncbi:MAG: flavin reductase family protein [Halobacteriota archaeon]